MQYTWTQFLFHLNFQDLLNQCYSNYDPLASNIRKYRSWHAPILYVLLYITTYHKIEEFETIEIQSLMILKDKSTQNLHFLQMGKPLITSSFLRDSRHPSACGCKSPIYINWSFSHVVFFYLLCVPFQNIFQWTQSSL